MVAQWLRCLTAQHEVAGSIGGHIPMGVECKNERVLCTLKNNGNSSGAPFHLCGAPHNPLCSFGTFHNFNFLKNIFPDKVWPSAQITVATSGSVTTQLWTLRNCRGDEHMLSEADVKFFRNFAAGVWKLPSYKKTGIVATTESAVQHASKQIWGQSMYFLLFP